LEAGKLYGQSALDVPEITYYKMLERLSKAGIITHLTKGLYYRPRKSRFGTVPISEKEIIDYYTSDGKGFVVGYQLYNRKGLTTQIGKKAEILSAALIEQKKNIGNVSVSKIMMELASATVSTIEVLEILQNFNSIEDINSKAFVSYMREFAAVYSDEKTEYVLQNCKYKKLTIAFLKKCLSYMRVKNNLNRYLSPLSEHAVPDIRAHMSGSKMKM